MGKLRHLFRLFSLVDDLETGLLREEFRSALLDDPFDRGREHELRAGLSDVSRQITRIR